MANGHDISFEMPINAVIINGEKLECKNITFEPVEFMLKTVNYPKHINKENGESITLTDELINSSNIDVVDINGVISPLKDFASKSTRELGKEFQKKMDNKITPLSPKQIKILENHDQLLYKLDEGAVVLYKMMDSNLYYYEYYKCLTLAIEDDECLQNSDKYGIINSADTAEKAYVGLIEIVQNELKRSFLPCKPVEKISDADDDEEVEFIREVVNTSAEDKLIHGIEWENWPGFTVEAVLFNRISYILGSDDNDDEKDVRKLCSQYFKATGEKNLTSKTSLEEMESYFSLILESQEKKEEEIPVKTKQEIIEEFNAQDLHSRSTQFSI